MLNLFSSSSSESPLFQVIFMKNHAENPLFEGLCYNHKGFELFSKTNFESSWAFEWLKICNIMYFVLPFWFLASTFLVPTPLSLKTPRLGMKDCLKHLFNLL